MKHLWAITPLTGGIGFVDTALSDERIQQQNRVPGTPTICAQVISCGTKDGRRLEYPTPCAARDDGATDIASKTGPTCDAAP
jgi:hypothetical protein